MAPTTTFWGLGPVPTTRFDLSLEANKLPRRSRPRPRRKGRFTSAAPGSSSIIHHASRCPPSLWLTTPLVDLQASTWASNRLQHRVALHQSVDGFHVVLRTRKVAPIPPLGPAHNLRADYCGISERLLEYLGADNLHRSTLIDRSIDIPRMIMDGDRTVPSRTASALMAESNQVELFRGEATVKSMFLHAPIQLVTANVVSPGSPMCGE